MDIKMINVLLWKSGYIEHVFPPPVLRMSFLWQVLSNLGETPDVIQCCPEIQNLIPLRSDEYMC